MAEYKPLRPIQPVSLPSFQYGLANVKVGRSGYQDLADALSQINPALQQFGRISRAKQQLILQQEEEERLAREAEIAKGREAFKLDPSGVSEQLKNLTRKGVNAGVIPENANAPFIIGGLQAQGEVLVNRDYRDQLRSLVETTNDPEVAIAQTKAEFLKRPEFSDPSVRAYAAEVFGKVDDEFRKDVNSRLDAVRTETNKRAWLELGRPIVDQVISGQLDVNDPNMIGWINHAAGVFKGSQEYAWTNLISETLNEGLSKDPSEEGSISPQQAEKFLDKLRSLDLGGGVKFADAEVGNSITSYYDKINDKRSKWEARKNEQLKTQYETNKGVLTNLLFEAMGDGNTVPTEDARKLKAAFLQQTPLQYDAQASADFESILKSINQPSDDASKLVVGSFDTLIAEGEDLTRVQKDIDKAFSSNSISAKERLTLLNKIESERDFDKLVHKTEGVRKLSESYEELITGFRSMRIGKATYEDSYFAQLGIPDDLPINDRQDTKKNGSIFSQIANTKGGYEAKRFVNNRYYAFQKYFRQANLFKFKEYEADPETTPQEAANKVLEEMRETATEVFKVWENESIREAQRLYGIVVYKKAEDIPEPEF